MMRRIKSLLIKLLPGVVFILLWEFYVRYRGLKFFYGLPSEIFDYLVKKTIDGSLPYDTFLTLTETVIGFIAGNLLGVSIGLSLWFSKTAFNIAKPYIVALGSAPIFALAPLMIIWFGTGIFSKIMMATLSTLFIALFQAYSGASEVNPEYIKLLKVYKASKMQIFRKIIVPSSVVWVISAFKINVGFALLGAFIGEFISSSAGLGHLIMVASGLFNISLVLTGVFMLIAIAVLLNFLVGKLEMPLKKAIVKYL
jgi:NitT/TauT family transport system permease protein